MPSKPLRYYIGPNVDDPKFYIVFGSRITPTRDTLGSLVQFCSGPYDKHIAVLLANYYHTYGPVKVLEGDHTNG